MALTNRVLAADRVAPGDDEAVAAVLERLVATLDLAIERLAQGDDERGAAALRTIPLGAALPPRRQPHRQGEAAGAHARAAKGPFGKRGFELAETDDAAVLEAVTRLRPMFPRLLDEPPAAGERPFRRLADLARAAAAIEQAAAAQALVRGLGVTAEDVAAGGPALAGTGADEAALDLGTLARTALVARLLAAAETKTRRAADRFRPLTPDEVKAFEALPQGRPRGSQAPKLSPGAGEERAGASWRPRPRRRSRRRRSDGRRRAGSPRWRRSSRCWSERPPSPGAARRRARAPGPSRR